MRWKVFLTVLFCATLLISQSVKAQDNEDSVTNTGDEINNEDYVDTDVDTDVVANDDTAPEPDAEDVISDDVVEEEKEEEVVPETESLEAVNVDPIQDEVETSDVILSRMPASSKSGNYADGLWLDNLDVSGNDNNYNWGKLLI